MDQLRKILATIQKYLGGMTATQKLLIGSVVVIMLMTLFLVSQYAGAPSLVEVWPGAAAEDQTRAMTYLKSAGFDPVNKNNTTWVSAAKRDDAFARLQLAGQQPANSTVVF